MAKEIRDVFLWYYKFTQVGAISQAREDNKNVFKIACAEYFSNLVWPRVYKVDFILCLTLLIMGFLSND